MSAEERNVTSGRKNFDLFIRLFPGGSGYSESRYDPQVGGQTTLKSFVCPSERDPVSPPQQPAIQTLAGLAARRTDSFRVRSGICRADQTVGNRNGDTGHCSRGTEARKRFAPYSKGNSPIRGKADLKIFVCPPVRDPASPPQQPAILTVAGIAARRTDLFGVRSELFQVDGAVNVRGCHSLFGRSGNPKPYRSVLQRDFPATGEIPGTSRKG